MQYTKEQVEDITTREKKALEALKKLELFPSASLSYENLGNDTFATKVVPFLQDSKYLEKK